MPARPRVLLLVADHRPTGTALIALRHARSLRAAGVDARVVGKSGRSLERLGRSESLWQPHRLHLDRGGRPWLVAQDLRRCARLVRAVAPRAVIAYGSNEQIIAGTALRGGAVPVLRYINAAATPLADGAGPRQAFTPAEAALLRVAGVRGVLAADPAVLGLLPRWQSQGRARWVPAGVDTRRFHPHVPGRDAWRSRLAPQGDAMLCGVLAAYKPERGYALFLRAFAQVAATRPALRAVLAGDGSAAVRGALTSLIANLGLDDRVVLVDPSHDLPGFWASLDIGFICHPGTGGGGSAMWEGLASGTAMIAGDQGPLRHLAGHGAHALVVPGPTAPDFAFTPTPQATPAEEALVAALARLTDDASERQRLGAAARRSAITFGSTRCLAAGILATIIACHHRAEHTTP